MFPHHEHVTVEEVPDDGNVGRGNARWNARGNAIKGVAKFKDRLERVYITGS
jgi:hypothetical protein